MRSRRGGLSILVIGAIMLFANGFLASGIIFGNDWRAPGLIYAAVSGIVVGLALMICGNLMYQRARILEDRQRDAER